MCWMLEGLLPGLAGFFIGVPTFAAERGYFDGYPWYGATILL